MDTGSKDGRPSWKCCGVSQGPSRFKVQRVKVPSIPSTKFLLFYLQAGSRDFLLAIVLLLGGNRPSSWMSVTPQDPSQLYLPSSAPPYCSLFPALPFCCLPLVSAPPILFSLLPAAFPLEFPFHSPFPASFLSSNSFPSSDGPSWVSPCPHHFFPSLSQGPSTGLKSLVSLPGPSPLFP